MGVGTGPGHHGWYASKGHIEVIQIKKKMLEMQILKLIKNNTKTKPQHVTHFLKLVDQMCKNKIDPMCIVEDIEWTWFCPQTASETRRKAGHTAGQMAKTKPVYPAFNFVEVGVITNDDFPSIIS